MSIFTTIWNYLVNAEQKVEHIVADLHKTVGKLVAHADAKAIEADRHTADAVASSKLAEDADAERVKAATVAGKIGALLS